MYKFVLKIFQVLEGRPYASMSWTTFLNLDGILMLDNILILGQLMNGRTGVGPIVVVSYMLWTTTQGQTILVTSPSIIIIIIIIIRF